MINPNTSESMTNEIDKIAQEFSTEDFKIQTVHAAEGPITIDDFYDDSIATIGVLREVKKGIKVGFDGFVIACAFDPGLYAARQLSDVPVIGISEASILLSCMLGYKFSILTLTKKAVSVVEEQIKRYGMGERLASIRTIDLNVQQVEEDKELTIKRLKVEGKKAIEEDRADVLILGCAGMVGLDKKLEEELGVPTIDPVRAGLTMIKALLQFNKRTSRQSAFMYPDKKVRKGRIDPLSEDPKTYRH
ncbi:MAG: aspartate/glutamate racemase family protein [Nitrososphaeria archaeon]